MKEVLLRLFADATLIGALLLAGVLGTGVVRLQHERQHALVDTGVYAVVRHPFYAGTPLVLAGMCSWVESYAAAGASRFRSSSLCCATASKIAFSGGSYPAIANTSRASRIGVFPASGSRRTFSRTFMARGATDAH